jgi:hypothetical protein
MKERSQHTLYGENFEQAFNLAAVGHHAETTSGDVHEIDQLHYPALQAGRSA